MKELLKDTRFQPGQSVEVNLRFVGPEDWVPATIERIVTDSVDRTTVLVTLHTPGSYEGRVFPIIDSARIRLVNVAGTTP